MDELTEEQKDIYERLKKINYTGCKRFYEGVHEFQVLEVLTANEWVDNLQHYIHKDEYLYIKLEKQYSYLNLEMILVERPEVVCEFYRLLFTIDALKKLEKMQREINHLVRDMPPTYFYSEEGPARNENLPLENLPRWARDRNFAINEQRINLLKKWALQDLRSKGLITIDEADSIKENRSCLFKVLVNKISGDIWNKLLKWIRDDLKMSDLARCLLTMPSDKERSEVEVSSICNQMELPKNFVERRAYCDELKRIIASWKADGKRKVLLRGDNDCGLSTLATFAARHAVKTWTVDRVTWIDGGDVVRGCCSEGRTLIVLDAECKKYEEILNRACFVIAISREYIDNEDFEVIEVAEGLQRDECRELLVRSNLRELEGRLDELAAEIVKRVPDKLSAVCEVIKKLKDDAEEVKDYDAEEISDWLDELDLEVNMPSYSELNEKQKKLYNKFVLFCDNEVRISVHSMMTIWDLPEKQTRLWLSKFEKMLLLIKGKEHEGCRTYRLASRHKLFLRNRLTEADRDAIAQDVVNKYGSRLPDVQDQFFYSQIVRLLRKVGPQGLNTARNLLMDVKFLQNRIASHTVASVLGDFRDVNHDMRGRSGRKFHDVWAIAEVAVPAALACDGTLQLRRCAGLQLLGASRQRLCGITSSWRLHDRHRFERRPFLPKVSNGRIIGRNREGHVSAFPAEEFFIDFDRSPDGKLLILASNLNFIYLLDCVSFEKLDSFNCKSHVFFVHFLSDERFIAIANQHPRYFSISPDKVIVDESDKEKKIADWRVLSDEICQERMTMDKFIRPVALYNKKILWVADENRVCVYSCDVTLKDAQILFRMEDAAVCSFIAATSDDEDKIEIAAACRASKVHLLKFDKANMTGKVGSIHAEPECIHTIVEPNTNMVRAAAWMGLTLVFSSVREDSRQPLLTIGSLNLETFTFQKTRTLNISFSPNFALSCRHARQFLFGEVGGRVAIFNERLSKEQVVPLPNPQAMAVRVTDDAVELMTAFGTQRVAFLEWPGYGRRDCPTVPVAVPVALTERLHCRIWFRHAPNVVLRVCAIGKNGHDLAVVVHEGELHFVRMPDFKIFLHHKWPRPTNHHDRSLLDDLKNAVCITDGHFQVVIATRQNCFRYHLLERRIESLEELPKATDGNPCFFESLVLCGKQLYCCASTSENENFFRLFVYDDGLNGWNDITGNNQINSSHLVTMKDDTGQDLLLFLPAKSVYSVIVRFDLTEKMVIGCINEVSKPLIHDVSAKESRLAVVRGHRVSVYEFKADGTDKKVSQVSFDGASSIHAVRFMPEQEHLLSIVFAANTFCNLKVCVWDTRCKDVFEFDIRNAITSFTFFEEQQLNSKLFWSLKTKTALLLTDRSLVKIDLDKKTTESDLELDSEWLLGSQHHRFDVRKSFASDTNIYLVLENSEMYLLQQKQC